MSDADFTRASDVVWEDYYRATEGRELRPLFLDAIEFVPAGSAEDRRRVAIDLGCGDGTETIALLRSGWKVTAIDGAAEAIARLRASIGDEDAAGLSTVIGPFQEVALPDADFVYAGLSLPFCPPLEFDRVWRGIRKALRPRAIFAGHFFGPNDSWVGTLDMTFHTRVQLDALLAGLDVHVLKEQDEDGEAVSGPKHWHVFHVIAANVDADSGSAAECG